MNNILTASASVDFESIYLQVREKEGRIYSNEEVRLLPEVGRGHRHFEEWQVRRNSCESLVRHISEYIPDPAILEIGCGNGWLSHRLAAIPGSRVTATDINFAELSQAAHVFQSVPRLHFVCGAAANELFATEQFDCIVLAASVQYFPSLRDLLRDLLPLLRKNGEIHILDSPFYQDHELIAAKERTRAYYANMGFPEMSNYYFHHGLGELRGFRYNILSQPGGIFNRIMGNKNPFYWIVILRN